MLALAVSVIAEPVRALGVIVVLVTFWSPIGAHFQGISPIVQFVSENRDKRIGTYEGCARYTTLLTWHTETARKSAS